MSLAGISLHEDDTRRGLKKEHSEVGETSAPI
jgi:hypothetical protein